MMVKFDLINEIKTRLDIAEGEVPLEKLFTLLQKARNDSHPDKHPDLNIKVEKQKEFSELANLLNELKEYIQSKNNDNKLALCTNPDNHSEKIYDLIKIDNLENELLKAKAENEHLQEDRRINKERLDTLKSDIHNEQEFKIKESLSEVYKSRKEKATTLISVIIIILYQIKSLKSLINDIFDISQLTINAILIAFIVVSLIMIIYKAVLRQRVDFYLARLIQPQYLNEINAKIAMSKVGCDIKYNYLTEGIIYDYVKSHISKIDNTLFLLNGGIVLNEMTNYIILNLDRKNLIKEVRPDSLELRFVLHTDNSIY